MNRRDDSAIYASLTVFGWDESMDAADIAATVVKGEVVYKS